VRKILILVFAAAAAFGQGPDGNDISTAIPIYFGQVVTDIGDASLSPNKVYKITLGRGQRFTAIATRVGAERDTWNLVLLRPAARTVRGLANADVLTHTYQNDCCWDRNYDRASHTLEYQVPASGDYYLWAHFGTAGVNYKLELKADGIPLDTPLPAEAGCMTGQVDYLNFSLKFISLNLPDDLSIGGVKACPTCTVKPPLYSAIVEKLESALKANVNVEACHDAQGNIIRVKMLRP